MKRGRNSCHVKIKDPAPVAILTVRITAAAAPVLQPIGNVAIFHSVSIPPNKLQKWNEIARKCRHQIITKNPTSRRIAHGTGSYTRINIKSLTQVCAAVFRRIHFTISLLGRRHDDCRAICRCSSPFQPSTPPVKSCSSSPACFPESPPVEPFLIGAARRGKTLSLRQFRGAGASGAFAWDLAFCSQRSFSPGTISSSPSCRFRQRQSYRLRIICALPA